jgi:nicotinamidase-related amidase
MPAEHARTALLVLDVQSLILDRLPDKDAYLARVRAAVSVARQKGIPVRHSVASFRPGMPEVSARNQAFARFKGLAASPLVDARPVLGPEEGDLLITKRRASAFSGSDLEVVLRADDVQHVVLCGLVTGGVVLSTLTEAADKDFKVTVLSDLCADVDPEVHRVLIEKVFPRHAQVMTSEAWAASLE